MAVVLEMSNILSWAKSYISALSAVNIPGAQPGKETISVRKVWIRDSGLFVWRPSIKSVSDGRFVIVLESCLCLKVDRFAASVNDL